MLRSAPGRSRLLLLLPLLGLVAAACGDGGGGAAASPTATRTATAAAPTGTPLATRTATAVDTGTATAAPSPSPTPSRTAAPTATVPLPTSAAVLARGPYGSGVTTMTFVDTTRPTMPNGTYAGTAARQLVTEVWYPADAAADGATMDLRDAALASAGQPFPLVLYSHGYSEGRLGGAYLARHLASHGYIVAAPDFPLSNGNAPGGPTMNDLPDQPRDLSFLLDQLLAGPRFGAAIDAQRIGVAGLSLGGWTTYLAAYHPTLRDPRVRAAAPIAALGCSLSHAYFAGSSAPLLIVHGDLDAAVPYDANARTAYTNANPPKRLVTVHNGSHTGFSGLATLLPGDNPDEIGCSILLDALDKSPANWELLYTRLGGSAAGIDATPCVALCTATTPLPPAVRNARQLELATLSVYPFFAATLRGDAAMQRFLDEGLATENSEIAVEAEP